MMKSSKVFKKLFEDTHYSAKAYEFCHRVEQAIRPIVDGMVAEGYDPRDIQNILFHAAFDVGVEKVLNYQMDNKRKVWDT